MAPLPEVYPWLYAVFSARDGVRPFVEMAMITAAAKVIEEKCETGHYWAGSVARDVFIAMGNAFSVASNRDRPGAQ
jgi:hypothetical protein